MNNLILLGIQGSGKGTQAKILVEKYGFKIFETGGELRSIAKTDTELAKRIKSIIESGNLVDSETIMDLVENFLNENKESNIIFDGIPRNIDQYNAFTKLEEKLQLKTRVVNFDLSDDKALARLLKRAEIENRSDDTPEVISKRIEIFHTQTKPLLSNFAKSHEVYHVNADQDIEAIHLELVSKLKLND